MVAEVAIPKAMTCTPEMNRFKKAVPLHNILVSTKLDGVRCMATVGADNKVTYYSRGGKVFKNFHVFDEGLLALAEAIQSIFGISPQSYFFDGEVTDPSGSKFSEIMKQVHRMKEVDMTGMVFQLFDMSDKQAPLGVRLSMLYGAMELNPAKNVTLVEHFNAKSLGVSTYEDLYKVANRVKALGNEGIVCKDTMGLYEEDKEAPHWLKIVDEDGVPPTLDLPVVGKVEGKGKHKGRLGALTCELPEGGTVDIGVGFTDREREEFWETPPTMIEVAYRGYTDKGSLRFPRYLTVREDKSRDA